MKKATTKPTTKKYATMLFSIDKELQERFREAVFKKEGCYRKMSKIVCSLMEGYINDA